MREIHSDEARLVRNFAQVSLRVRTGHPMFEEPGALTGLRFRSSLFPICLF